MRILKNSGIYWPSTATGDSPSIDHTSDQIHVPMCPYVFFLVSGLLSASSTLEHWEKSVAPARCKFKRIVRSIKMTRRSLPPVQIVTQCYSHHAIQQCLSLHASTTLGRFLGAWFLKKNKLYIYTHSAQNSLVQSELNYMFTVYSSSLNCKIMQYWLFCYLQGKANGLGYPYCRKPRI